MAGKARRANAPRAIKDATVKHYFYETHAKLRTHLADFVTAYNFARRLKTLKGLTPYEFICKLSTKEPDRFILDPLHQMPGLNIHHDYLMGLIRRTPDITLLEIQERLIKNCDEHFSSSVLWRFFDRHGVTFKKSARTPPSSNVRTC